LNTYLNDYLVIFVTLMFANMTQYQLNLLMPILILSIYPEGMFKHVIDTLKMLMIISMTFCLNNKLNVIVTAFCHSEPSYY